MPYFVLCTLKGGLMEHGTRRPKRVWVVRTTASPISLYRDRRITLKELIRVYAMASADEIPRNLPRWIRRGIEKLRNGQHEETTMTHAPDKNRGQNGARAGQTGETPDRLTPYDLHDELLGLMSHRRPETPYCDRPRIPRSGLSPVDVAERMDGIYEDT